MEIAVSSPVRMGKDLNIIRSALRGIFLIKSLTVHTPRKPVQGKRAVTEKGENTGGHPDIIGDHVLLCHRNGRVHHLVEVCQADSREVTEGKSLAIISCTPGHFEIIDVPHQKEFGEMTLRLGRISFT